MRAGKRREGDGPLNGPKNDGASGPYFKPRLFGKLYRIRSRSSRPAPWARLHLAWLQGNVVVDGFRFAGRPRPPRAHNIDRRGVERVLDVSRVEFLDHLDAGAAVLGDLIDVGPFHEPHANVRMSQAISRAPVTVAVKLELCPPEDAVEQLDVIAWKYRIGRLRIFHLRRFGPIPCARAPAAIARNWHSAVAQALVGTHGARHALAVADTTFADFDLKNSLAGRIVRDDRHIAVLKVAGHCLVRPQASVGHEQDIVVHLFGIPLMALTLQIVSVLPGGCVELLIFRRAEPGTMNDLPGRFERGDRSGG
jgi:hypothetical protein